MEDEKIIQLFFARSQSAVEATQERYGTLCHRIAMNLLNSQQDAQECVNDTWYALWNAIPPEKPKNLGAFVAKITRNLAMKRLAYLRAEKRQVLTVPYEELDGCASAGASPEMLLEAKELEELLRRFLNGLDRDSRDLFLRRYWFFDSVEMIARGFSMSETRVTTKLYRIRKKLKDYLAKEAGIYVR